jgi:hypothetical protein
MSRIPIVVEYDKNRDDFIAVSIGSGEERKQRFYHSYDGFLNDMRGFFLKNGSSRGYEVRFVGINCVPVDVQMQFNELVIMHDWRGFGQM